MKAFTKEWHENLINPMELRTLKTIISSPIEDITKSKSQRKTHMAMMSESKELFSNGITMHVTEHFKINEYLEYKLAKSNLMVNFKYLI